MGEDRGAFLSFIDELSRPGQIVRNLLAGRGESAWHQTEQLGANALDAILPGDWLPNDLAKPEDYISGRDLVGAPDDFTGHAIGFGVDLLTDPLSYLPPSWAAKGLGKAGELASAGINAADKVLPGTAEAVAKTGRTIRDFAGQQRADHPELWNAIDRIRGTSAVEGSAGMAATKKALAGLDQRQRQLVGDAVDNVRWGADGKPIGELVPSGMDPTTGVPFGGLNERIAAHPDLLPGEADKLTDAANQLMEISRNQKARPGVFDAESQAQLPDEYLQRQYKGLKKDPLEELMGDSGPGLANALKERKNKDWRDILATLEANPGSSYERDALVRMAQRSSTQADLAKKADTGAAIMDLLRQGKMSLPEEMVTKEASKLRSAAVKPPVPESGAYEDVGAMLGGKPAEVAPSVAEEVEPGLTDAMNEAHVGDQTGESVVGASAKQPVPTIADFKPEEIEAATKSILGRDFAVSDPESKAIVRGALGELAKTSPETAKLALDTINGLGPRNGLLKALATGNQYFKRAMTYGMGIPRASAIIRNRINHIQQTFDNEATRGQTLQMLKTLPSDLTSAIGDAFGIKALRGKTSGTIEEWENALANSAGDGQKALAEFGKTHPEEAALIGNGVIDGYVRSDDLIKEIASSPRMQKIKSFLDMPASIARGLEDRARLQLGKLQLQKYMGEGMSMDEAAKKAVGDVGSALYRYGITSANHRTVRDIMPYSQWVLQAAPATAKALAKNPQYLSVVANAMSRDPKDDPLPPYLEGKATIDLGKDENGQRQVISGMSWPWETLSDIPNPSASAGDLGRELEQDVVGMANPALKTLYALTAGHEPAFSTPFGAYSRVPLAGDAGEAGRLYNELASTGITAPIDAPARVLDRLLDDRRSVPLRLLNSLSGASIDTVDPVSAKAQQLQLSLQRDPDVASIAHMHSDDPEAAELIRELADVQKKMKAKRKKAASSSP